MSDALNPVRAFRKRERISLEALADRIQALGIERPSAAKLSRIERDQPIPLELLPALEKITGTPAALLRPDIARIMNVEAAE